MPKLRGTLMADLHPENRTVRIVFISTFAAGNVAPVNAIDLDAAEIIFQTCGLSEEQAAAFRGKVQRNKVASIEVTVDEEVAAKFQYKGPLGSCARATARLSAHDGRYRQFSHSSFFPLKCLTIM
jgi:hypothetical protein